MTNKLCSMNFCLNKWMAVLLQNKRVKILNLYSKILTQLAFRANAKKVWYIKQ